MSEMPKHAPYAEILDACWHAIQQGDADVSACLNAYPHHAEALQRDLQLARALGKLRAPALPADRVEALEARLLNQFQSQQVRVVPRRPSPRAWLGRSVATLLLAFFIALGGTGVTVAAAADSMPDETLYVVKRWWESIVVLIAQFIGNLDEIWLQIAQTRLEEWLYMGGQEADTHILQALLDDLAHAIEQVEGLADEAMRPRLVTFTVSTQTILTQNNALGQVDDNLNMLFERITLPGDEERPEVIVVTVLPATPTPEPTATTRAEDTTRPVEPSPTATVTTTREARPLATSTPRLPATPTLTITPRPSMTFTPSPVPPSATWTPTWTPLPSLPAVVPTITPRRPDTNGDTSVTRPPATPMPDDNATIFIRQTQAAVEITQTAEAQVTEEVRP